MTVATPRPALPATLRVGPFVYAVVRAAVVRADDDTRLHGQINFQTLVIRVSAGLAPMQERETLLHEAIHAIDHAARIGLTEKQVSRLSMGLLAALLDNPALRAEPVPEGG